MEQVALVIFTKPWAMLDENTGEKREGITVEYVMADNLEPVTSDDGSKGVRHCKESLDSSKAQSIKQVPGYYKLDFTLKSGSKGKPVLKLDNMEFLRLAQAPAK